MIPFDEFATTAARAGRRDSLFFIALPTALPLMFVQMTVGKFLLPLPQAVADNVALTIPLLFFACFIVAMFWLDRRAASLRCPHCRASLKKQASLTIATRNCCQCGAC